ncbi:MAG: tRNA 2-thiouridine(34) synthase MnmA [Candidatus Zixiibacteriota bacterium]
MTKSQNIVLGFSGGVDSTAAALLLKKQGYNVHAVSLIMTEIEYTVYQIAEKLGIELHIIDIRDAFHDKVITHTADQYAKGLTPNPCIACNKEIKWKYLFDFADKNNIENVASGHYARIIHNEDSSFLAKDPVKVRDQSYFMYRIKREYLPRMVLPLGEFTRVQSEELLEAEGYLEMIRHRSRDLCILSAGSRSSIYEFLGKNIEFTSGDLYFADRQKIGEHKSLQSLTIGQRKGLGITWEYPLYVLDVDLEDKKAILGPKEMLKKTKFKIIDTNFLTNIPLDTFEAMVKIRNTHQGTMGNIFCDADSCEIELCEPVMGVSPGQSAVFYDGDIVLGGGIIAR